ncbi:hypothetical protein [Telluribacter sp.]|jgi:hypothetical protein|uniref:hypothetical protein n=1 Tax=Telluribacter sp. TaxID=1978767 RepID=UPI002E15C2CB|nr:hypothetical protein [Telluribacter sp.]
MKFLRKLVLVPALAVVTLLASCEKEDVVKVDSQLTGTWQLEAITYGLSQTTVRGAQLPYSEKIEFSGTNYTQTRDGKVESSGRCYTGESQKNAPYKSAVIYPDDNTYQAYEISEGRLYLYERGTQGSVVADGSLYEYKRQ